MTASTIGKKAFRFLGWSLILGVIVFATIGIVRWFGNGSQASATPPTPHVPAVHDNGTVGKPDAVPHGDAAQPLATASQEPVKTANGVVIGANPAGRAWERVAGKTLILSPTEWSEPIPVRPAGRGNQRWILQPESEAGAIIIIQGRIIDSATGEQTIVAEKEVAWPYNGVNISCHIILAKVKKNGTGLVQDMPFSYSYIEY